MKKIVLLVLLFVVMKHSIYGILGDVNNSLWVLYYHLCPVIFIIGILTVAIKNNIGKALIFFSRGLILITVLYYLDIARKYEPDYFEFMSKMSNEPIYWVTALFLVLSVITIIKYRK